MKVKNSTCNHLDFSQLPAAEGMRFEKAIFAWLLSLPRKLRPQNLKTQKDFSKSYNISENSLSTWKKEKDFQRLRTSLMKNNFIDRTPDVIENLYRAATADPLTGKSPVPAIRLWLEFIEDWRLNQPIESEPEEKVIFQFATTRSPFINPED